MQQTKIGPFTVHSLKVSQGLHLMEMAGKIPPEQFQNEIVRLCVRRDGADIGETDFGELMPHYKDLVEAAFTLNGFRDKPEGEFKEE